MSLTSKVLRIRSTDCKILEKTQNPFHKLKVDRMFTNDCKMDLFYKWQAAHLLKQISTKEKRWMEVDLIEHSDILKWKTLSSLIIYPKLHRFKSLHSYQRSCSLKIRLVRVLTILFCLGTAPKGSLKMELLTMILNDGGT